MILALAIGVYFEGRLSEIGPKGWALYVIASSVITGAYWLTAQYFLSSEARDYPQSHEHERHSRAREATNKASPRHDIDD